jgi:hypothetical protein
VTSSRLLCRKALSTSFPASSREPALSVLKPSSFGSRRYPATLMLSIFRRPGSVSAASTLLLWAAAAAVICAVVVSAQRLAGAATRGCSPLCCT